MKYITTIALLFLTSIKKWLKAIEYSVLFTKRGRFFRLTIPIQLLILPMLFFNLKFYLGMVIANICTAAFLAYTMKNAKTTIRSTKMKSTLIILFSIISINCFGQKGIYDSVSYNADTTEYYFFNNEVVVDSTEIVYLDSSRFTVDGNNKIIPRYPGYGEIYTYTPPPVYDTVKCIIQYSDTSRPFIKNYRWGKITQDTIPFYDSLVGGIVTGSIHLNATLDTTWLNYDYSVKWMYGYSVREYGEDFTLVNHTKYLDENYKPISDNIIVWQSKEL